MSAEVANYQTHDRTYDTSNSTQHGIFTTNAGLNLKGSIALRAFLAQDRILYLEKKFFCDKATEKTVYLMVKDQFDTGSHKQVHTKKVSCQFPILEIWDLSSINGDNKLPNGWEVTNDFPTLQQVEDLGLKKEYNATVWARDGEEITFHVKFGAGSHIGVNWTIEEVLPNTHNGGASDIVVDDCETKDSGGFPSRPNGWSGSFDTWSSAKPCVFPFRYDNVLYYGCAQLPAASYQSGPYPNAQYSLCATEIDSDYNAMKMGHCNADCHHQVPYC